MQNTSHYYKYYLRVISGATYYERGIESYTKWKQLRVVYITTLISTEEMFCNQMMTQQKQINLPYLMVYKAMVTGSTNLSLLYDVIFKMSFINLINK